MPRRQLIVYKLGCGAALLTAVLHMIGIVSGRPSPANETERQLLELATTYRFPMPGGSERTFIDFLDGFSLMFSLFCALIAGLAYIVQKRAAHDLTLMLGVSRAIAGAFAVLLVISLTHFFVVPSMFIALVTTCFTLSSVRGPDSDGGPTL